MNKFEYKARKKEKKIGYCYLLKFLPKEKVTWKTAKKSYCESSNTITQRIIQQNI